MLKKEVGDNNITIIIALPAFQDDQIIVAPEKVLQTRTISRESVPIPQGLIKWCNLPEEDATWKTKPLSLLNFLTYPFLGVKKVFNQGVLSHIIGKMLRECKEYFCYK